MGLFKIFINVLKISFKLNLIKTIYFNFKVLPFEQAIKLPFHFYGKTDFANLSGKFTLSSNKVHFGMIVFGGKHEVVISPNQATRIYNSGEIVFCDNLKFARGINIMVWDNGNLSFGENFSIGSLSRIICFRNIKFGNDVLISWECQFFDTDFHFIKNNENKIKDNCAEVIVNNGVWIGTRATILKGTTISNNSIVGANSVCSGDYSKYGDGVLLAGIPVKQLKNGVEYIKNKRSEIELFNYFNEHQNSIIDWKN